MKKKYLYALLTAAVLGLCITGCDELDDDLDYEVTEEAEAEDESESEDESEAKAESKVEAESESKKESEAPSESDEYVDTEADEYVLDETEEPAESSEADEYDEAVEAEEVEETYPVGTGANISFDTVDIYGNQVSSDMLKNAKVVMLNLWEPWCGPCVGEMPELNELYEDYKDQGLLIIGSYSTFEMDADAKELVEELGISYPIIKCNRSISKIEQDYVPATFFLDHNGNLFSNEPVAGSRDYYEWEEIIKAYLK